MPTLGVFAAIIDKSGRILELLYNSYKFAKVCATQTVLIPS